MSDTRIIPPSIGLKVTLNSGSPILTVVDFYGRMLVCAWRDGDEVREQVFGIECVKVCNWDGK